MEPKTKITVTPEQVKENMQDVIVRTLDDFGKPTTYVTVKMKNGFTLRESTTCVDPANYNENIGRDICLEKIEDKVWFLLGYQLQEDIYRSVPSANGTWRDRLVAELNELEERIVRLDKALDMSISDAVNRYGDHYKWMLAQSASMKLYADALQRRLEVEVEK